MATESTRKHRPSIDDIRVLRADADSVVRARSGRDQDLADSASLIRAVYVRMALDYVLGAYAPGLACGLRTIKDEAAQLRAAAAPQTEAEVFERLVS